MFEHIEDLKNLEGKVSQMYVKNLEEILKNFGKKRKLKKRQCIDEIMNKLNSLLTSGDIEKFNEARKVILTEYAHFCEKKGFFFPTFESVVKVFNIPPAFQYISQLTDIQMLYLNSKNTIKFSLSHEQMNQIKQNNSSYHILTLLSEWRKGDNIINLPLVTLSNESNTVLK